MSRITKPRKNSALKRFLVVCTLAFAVAVICVPACFSYASEPNVNTSVLTKVFYDEDYDGIVLSFDDISLEEAKLIVTNQLGWDIKEIYDFDGGTWGKQYSSDGTIWRQILAEYPTNSDGTNYLACLNQALATEHITNAEGNGISEDGSYKSPARLSRMYAIGTMDAIVTQGWKDNSCGAVVVVNQNSATDGMVATGLAGLLSCPVITTDGSELSLQTKCQINRLGATTVYLVGGTSVLSEEVEQEIENLPYVSTVNRVWGYSAADTAVATLNKGNELGGWGNTAVIATASDFRDAMSCAPYSYAKHAPVLLSEEQGLSSDAAALASEFENILIVGGPCAVPETVEAQVGSAVVDREYGETAYDTSQAIADWCIEQGMTVASAGIATGENHMDAVAGAAYCGIHNAILLLVSDPSAAEALSYFEDKAVDYESGTIFGGTAVVSGSAQKTLQNMVYDALFPKDR